VHGEEAQYLLDHRPRPLLPRTPPPPQVSLLEAISADPNVSLGQILLGLIVGIIVLIVYKA
jgi:hypothetical protein